MPLYLQYMIELQEVMDVLQILRRVRSGAAKSKADNRHLRQGANCGYWLYLHGYLIIYSPRVTLTGDYRLR